MVKSMIITVVTLLAAWPAIAQQERKFIREGNELFEKQDFEKAEVEYRKAADKKANSFEAAFNMADALYKQKKYDEALEQFSALAKQETDKERLGEIYHNIGNTLLAMEKTDESIEAYKNSFRLLNKRNITWNLHAINNNRINRIRIRTRTRIKIKTKIRTRIIKTKIRTKTRISKIRIKINRIRIKTVKIRTKINKIRISKIRTKTSKIKTVKIRIKTSRIKMIRIKTSNNNTLSNSRVRFLRRMRNVC